MSNIPTVANVRTFEVARDNTVANVLAITGGRVETAAAYDQKVRDVTGGKLELVPGSLRKVKTEVASALPAVAFHVRAVRESLPYEEAANMRTVVEANVFEDTSDSIWQVVEANGVKRLLKKTDTDIGALLAKVAATNVTFVAASTYAANALDHFQNGNFIAYANANGELDHGVAVRGDDGAIHVVSVSTNEMVAIDDAQVVAHAPFTAVAEEGDTSAEVASLNVVTAAPLDSGQRVRVKDYYRVLYEKRGEFWAILSTQIDNMFKA
jgi:hypothetical protein